MPRALRAARRTTFEDLDAAIDERPPVDDRLVHQLNIASIAPSPRNPRQRVNNIAELADSLREHGLLQPVVVRRHFAAGYELVAGHRRLEAAKLLGWTEIAAVVRDESDDRAYILTLVENLQREDLSPKEEAAALEVLVRERGWTTRQVGEAIKRGHTYVSKRLRVFDDPVLSAPVLDGKLPVSTAEELLQIDDQAVRGDLVQRAVSENWGQGQARTAVRTWFVTNQNGIAGKGQRARAQQVSQATDTLVALLEVTAVSDLPAAARSKLRGLYQRLALLVAD